MDSEVEAWLNNAQLRESEVGPRVRLFHMSSEQMKDQKLCISALNLLHQETDLICIQEIQIALPPPF